MILGNLHIFVGRNPFETNFKNCIPNTTIIGGYVINSLMLFFTDCMSRLNFLICFFIFFHLSHNFSQTNLWLHKFAYRSKSDTSSDISKETMQHLFKMTEEKTILFERFVCLR
eukprot:UN06305